MLKKRKPTKVLKQDNELGESKSTNKLNSLLVIINAFIVGAVIMALEMIGSRFLTPYFGSSKQLHIFYHLLLLV